MIRIRRSDRTRLVSLVLGLGALGALGVLRTAAAQPRSTASPVAPAGAPVTTATTRALEGPLESATGVLDSFELTRRVRWSYENHAVGAGLGEYGIFDDPFEAQPVAAYEGPQVGTLTAKLHFDRSASGPARDLVAMVAPLERMAAEDPQLGRPPRVVFATQGIEFKGVVESVALRCSPARCDVDLTMREAEGAKVRPAPASSPRARQADAARLPDF